MFYFLAQQDFGGSRTPQMRLPLDGPWMMYMWVNLVLRCAMDVVIVRVDTVIAMMAILVNGL